MKINFLKWKCAAAVGMLLCMTDVAVHDRCCYFTDQITTL